MIQTRKLGIVNSNKGAKVHKVQTSYGDIGMQTYNENGLATRCTRQRVYRVIELDPSEADRLCQRCFKYGPPPWEGTT